MIDQVTPDSDFPMAGAPDSATAVLAEPAAPGYTMAPENTLNGAGIQYAPAQVSAGFQQVANGVKGYFTSQNGPKDALLKLTDRSFSSPLSPAIAQTLYSVAVLGAIFLWVGSAIDNMIRFGFSYGLRSLISSWILPVLLLIIVRAAVQLYLTVVNAGTINTDPTAFETGTEAFNSAFAGVATEHTDISGNNVSEFVGTNTNAPIVTAVLPAAPQPFTAEQLRQLETEIRSGRSESAFVSPAYAGVAPISPLKTNRHCWKFFLFTPLTLGIYPIVVMYTSVKALNTVAQKDGRKTMNYIGFLFLTVITAGIYYLIWNHQMAGRVNAELQRRGLPLTFGTGDFWLWDVLGTLFAFGPIVYFHKFLKVMNVLCADYNARGLA